MAYLGAIGRRDRTSSLAFSNTIIAAVLLAAITARLGNHGGYVYVA